MKLYWAPQSRAFRALWMLEEAGCAYERVLVDIRNGGQNDAAFRAVNPMAKVPALADGVTTVAESAAICAYVAERCPGAGLAPPVGDAARGAYLQWLFFAAGCIEPAYLQKYLGFDLPVSTAGWGSFERVLDVLEDALRPGNWLLGERFSAADVMVGTDLHYGLELMKIVPARPAFVDYLARCTARSAYQRAQAIDAASSS